MALVELNVNHHDRLCNHVIVGFIAFLKSKYDPDKESTIEDDREDFKRYFKDEFGIDVTIDPTKEIGTVFLSEKDYTWLSLKWL